MRRRVPGGYSRGLAIVLSVAGAIFVVVHFADLERFLRLLRQAQPIWLLAAVGLQALTYISVAMGWKQVLAKAENPRKLSSLLPIALSKLFADQAVPAAGMGGNLLLIDRLTRLGVSRGTAAATLIVSLIGYYVAYAFLALVMILVLWLQRDATPLLVGLVTAFLMIALAIPSLALWLRKRGSKPLPPQSNGSSRLPGFWKSSAMHRRHWSKIVACWFMYPSATAWSSWRIR